MASLKAGGRVRRLGILGVALLGGCSLFQPQRPFISTPVPVDFAVVIDEADDTYFARRHVHQVVSANDLMSRTTYTKYRDYNNSVSEEFTDAHPLNPAQLQAMWDATEKNRLLEGAFTWTYWQSDSDVFKREAKTLQVRAGGKTKMYRQINHWDKALRELVLLTDSVRLPSSTRPAGSLETPVLQPAMPSMQPGMQPATQPGTQPGTPAMP